MLAELATGLPGGGSDIHINRNPIDALQHAEDTKDIAAFLFATFDLARVLVHEVAHSAVNSNQSCYLALSHDDEPSEDDEPNEVDEPGEPERPNECNTPFCYGAMYIGTAQNTENGYDLEKNLFGGLEHDFVHYSGKVFYHDDKKPTPLKGMICCEEYPNRVRLEMYPSAQFRGRRLADVEVHWNTPLIWLHNLLLQSFWDSALKSGNGALYPPRTTGLVLSEGRGPESTEQRKARAEEPRATEASGLRPDPSGKRRIAKTRATQKGLVRTGWRYSLVLTIRLQTHQPFTKVFAIHQSLLFTTFYHVHSALALDIYLVQAFPESFEPSCTIEEQTSEPPLTLEEMLAELPSDLEELTTQLQSDIGKGSASVPAPSLNITDNPFARIDLSGEYSARYGRQVTLHTIPNQARQLVWRAIEHSWPIWHSILRGEEPAEILRWIISKPEKPGFMLLSEPRYELSPEQLQDTRAKLEEVLSACFFGIHLDNRSAVCVPRRGCRLPTLPGTISDILFPKSIFDQILDATFAKDNLWLTWLNFELASTILHELGHACVTAAVTRDRQMELGSQCCEHLGYDSPVAEIGFEIERRLWGGIPMQVQFEDSLRMVARLDFKCFWRPDDDDATGRVPVTLVMGHWPNKELVNAYPYPLHVRSELELEEKGWHVDLDWLVDLFREEFWEAQGGVGRLSSVSMPKDVLVRDVAWVNRDWKFRAYENDKKFGLN
ncbi:hypothetical protein BST61_g6515 [Cercospora zeina]